jgi:hypothetical protein
MEFIVTGLFIIFFSYILLYSLYDCLFKRSTIEGLENSDKEKDTKDDNKDGDNKDDKKDNSSTIEKAQKASSQVSEGNSKTNELNEKHPNLTIQNGMSGVNNIG